jgi:hypothetical protein
MKTPFFRHSHTFTSEFGTYEIQGPIFDLWRENGWLGRAVSEELRHPSGNSSYVVFEHGFIERPDDGSPPVAAHHDYLRLYGALRAQILSRFFAIGYHGRRNLLGTDNLIRSKIPEVPPVRAGHASWTAKTQVQKQKDAMRARWDTIATGGENPHLFGTWLFAMLAVEHAAGNDESTNALRQALDTLESLAKGVGNLQVPTRWDAGVPTDDWPAHRRQFLPRDGMVPLVNVPPGDLHHHPWRLHETLRTLMTDDDQQVNEQQVADYESRQKYYCENYRNWEPSQDEVVGMVTSLWLVNKLSNDRDILGQVKRQARRVGGYLASNGYFMVKTLGGLSWRGAGGALAAMEEPIARALYDITQEDLHSQADFKEVMELAGHWSQLAGSVGECQAAAWAVTVVGPFAAASILATVGLVLGAVTSPLEPVLGPVFGPEQVAATFYTIPVLGFSLGADAAILEQIFAGQIISPSTIGTAVAILWKGDCLDIDPNERGDLAGAVLAKDAPDKARLYRAYATVQAKFAKYNTWSVAFPGYLGLTGLDNSDPLVRDVFADWFKIRSALPATLPEDTVGGTEPPGVGASVKCWVAAVAAILENQGDPETELLKRLDSAICDMFRACYFDPQIPTVYGEDTDNEKPELLWREKLCVSPVAGLTRPYGPLDFCAAIALACWHAKRRADANNPVTVPGFPGPLTSSIMTNWMPAGVPVEVLDILKSSPRSLDANVIQSGGSLVSKNGVYPVFLDPPVPRRLPPIVTTPPADVLTDIKLFFLDPQTEGDLATGIFLTEGQALEVFADGDIWAGDLLEGRNDPDGLDKLVDDAGWPLHTGLDPGASKFCVLGRINGYFFIGSYFPKQKWVYREQPPDLAKKLAQLFLRINDPGPGDGDGGFVVRVNIYGPEGSTPHAPYDQLRDGGLLTTNEPRDRIFVHIEAGGSGSNAVEFALETPDQITWRKELAITSGNPADPGSWTVYTQDDRHEDVNGLWLGQLKGGSLVLRRLYPWPRGMVDVAQIDHLERATPGSRIVFRWYQD